MSDATLYNAFSVFGEMKKNIQKKNSCTCPHSLFVILTGRCDALQFHQSRSKKQIVRIRRTIITSTISKIDTDKFFSVFLFALRKSPII